MTTRGDIVCLDMALVLTEELIRERVHLLHDHLEDVKSLALPGTYQEKITAVGNSLKSFTRLKELDLSRNAISSLVGFDHLSMLGKLNLYYNNISDIDEFLHLIKTTGLKELDVRLNPVTRDNPDYRLHLIYNLPSLRILDDRTVTDRERNAAKSQHGDAEELSAPKHKHGAHLNGGTTRVDALDDDDVKVIDLLAQGRSDVTVINKDMVDHYTLSGLKDMYASPQSTGYHVELGGRQSATSRNTSPHYDQNPNVKSFGHFTPHPNTQAHSVNGSTSKTKIEMGVAQENCLHQLMDVVDKYWNGANSLHKNSKFKLQACRILESFTQFMRNEAIPPHKLNEGTQQRATKTELALGQAYTDLEELRQNVRVSKHENAQLLEKIASLKAESATEVVYMNQIEELKQENILLREQMDRLGNVGELEQMLRESHRRLVSTNEHLLDQVQQDKRRHQQEVEQLNWSYDQLKLSTQRFANSPS